MLRLLLDVSICFCPTPQPLLVVQSTSLLPYLLLHCPSISSVVFLGFFSHWYSCSVMLLAAVRFPFLIHVRTNWVFALLFCQPVSFLDIEYHAQSHFSSYHVLLLSTIFLTMYFCCQDSSFIFSPQAPTLWTVQQYWNYTKVSTNVASEGQQISWFGSIKFIQSLILTVFRLQNAQWAKCLTNCSKAELAVKFNTRL